MGRSARQRSRRAIPSHPLINFVHQRLEIILLAAVVLFILYTTCLPTIAGPEPEQGDSVLRLMYSKQDFAQNIALYIPLGFFLSLALRRRRTKWYVVAATTMIGACSLSCGAEFVQLILPGRIPSMIDVLCNVSGAAFGGLTAYFLRVGTRSSRRKMSDLVAHQPVFTSYILVGVLYVLLALVPFQLDLTPKTKNTILNPLRLAAFTPSRAVDLVDEGHTARGQYDHAIDLGVAFAAFALLGFLACWSLQDELGFGGLAAGFCVMWMILLLAAVLALVQMFIHQRGFQPILIPLSLAAAFIGILYAWTRLPQPGLRGWRSVRSFAICNPQSAMVWSWAGVLFCLAVITARELSPFEFDFSSATVHERWGQIVWIPFWHYFSSGDVAPASGDILAKFGRFFVFGMLLLLALRASKVNKVASCLHVGLWAAVVLAGLVEALQIACPARYPDGTAVLLAAGGSLSGTIAAMWWLELVRVYRPQPDDRHRPQSLVSGF